jgi:hypothetical protein
VSKAPTVNIAIEMSILFLTLGSTVSISIEFFDNFRIETSVVSP